MEMQISLESVILLLRWDHRIIVSYIFLSNLFWDPSSLPAAVPILNNLVKDLCIWSPHMLPQFRLDALPLATSMNSRSGGRSSIASRAAVGVVLMHTVVAMHDSF